MSQDQTLFVWSAHAWGGRIRLYGAAGLLAGGWLYFRLFSPLLLQIGYRTADLVTVLLRLVLLPMFGAIFLLKKINNLLILFREFSSGSSWTFMHFEKNSILFQIHMMLSIQLFPLS